VVPAAAVEAQAGALELLFVNVQHLLARLREAEGAERLRAAEEEALAEARAAVDAVGAAVAACGSGKGSRGHSGGRAGTGPSPSARQWGKEGSQLRL
jgi:hypothetical protein